MHGKTLCNSGIVLGSKNNSETGWSEAGNYNTSLVIMIHWSSYYAFMRINLD